MNKNKFFKIFLIIFSFLTILCFSFTLNTTVKASDAYETPDVISVGDLKKSGKPAGNVSILDEHHTFTYNKTTTYGSVVFKFKFKADVWDTWEDGSQFHLYNTWQMNGMFWLRKDAAYIAYDVDGTTKYAKSSSAISTGSHDVELGRLAVMNGDTYSGSQYYYIKIDDVLYSEHTITGLDQAYYLSDGLFTTGTSGNKIIDSNWTGSKVTFMSNGSVFKEINTTDDYITKPETDPVQSGKTFVGWYDKMGKEWDFNKNKVSDDLVLRAGFKSNEAVESNEVYFSDANYKPVLRFMVSSDVHIGTNPSRRDENLANAIDKAYSIANSNSKYKELDAALFAGDVSDSGDYTGLLNFKTIALAHLKNDTEFIVSMGNHDYRGASRDESISQFAELFGSVDKHLVINGYHFISLSPDLSQGEHFSIEKVEWLDNQLALAQQADPTKPIFVMQHEHIQGTVYGSDAWYVSELTDVICKYPQVVDFSGHSHYPLKDPRSIWQGTFTALGTGTMHYYELGINGYKNTGIFPTNQTGEWSTGASELAKASEFLIVEIDANNAIRVIAYDMMGDTEIARYYIRNAMDEIKFDYSAIERAKNSDSPVFNENASLVLTPVKATINVTFDQATSKDTVESYRIEVYKGSELIKTEYALSDYFYNPTPEKISYTIKGLSSDTEYNIKVYAVNVWNKESLVPLTGTTKTEVVIYEDEGYAPYDIINVLDINYPDNTGIISNVPSEGKQYQYPGTASNYTSIMQFYLITGDLTSKDEFRIQIGEVWKLYNTFWIQTGKYDVVFIGWIYSTKPSDRHKFETKSNQIYKIEFGTLMVEAGEHSGEGYTYVKIDNVVVGGFYIPQDEYKNKTYDISMHITENYKIADINLARTIEYYVDDNKVQEDFAISGLNIKEPAAPTKPGLFFVGWYTDPVGGDRVDFSKPYVSDEKITKYYARFTDTTYDVNYYDDQGNKINTVVAGKDCKIIKPDDPVKTGEYKYSFAKWVIKGTNEEFDFDSYITSDLDLEAVFEEYKYRIIYKVDGLEYTTRYYVESNPSEIIGGEPNVPSLVGATGKWEYKGERKNSDIYVRAIYDGIAIAETDEITLNKFNGSVVDIDDDITRFYLSFADTEEQVKWIVQYPVSGGHERQNISFSWADSSRNMSYLVYFADNIEFENAFIVKTDTKTIDYVGIFTPGKTYYWKVVGLGSEKSSEVDSFTVLNVPLRWISAGTVYNMRDIGGWTTIDNKTIKYELIYRGGQLALDQEFEKSSMNEYSFKVFDYLGMKTEIELRGEKPHDYNQFNELEKVISVNGGNYMGMFSLNDKTKQNYRDVFSALSDKSNYPFYFHCSWGADRTGSLGFLINGVLGVPLEQLVEDFEMTSFSYSGSRTRYNTDFMEMYEAFMTNYSNGGTLQDAIKNYLINYVGVKEEHINSLKSIMLSDDSSSLTRHKVTYIIDGEVYQESLIYDGTCVKEIAPVFFDRHLECWTLDGEPFDSNTKVTKDLVLVGRFKETLYEDYDIITVRDLGLGESYISKAGNHLYEGTASTGGRMFVFDYDITSYDDAFDDGVHIEIGPGVWDCRAHIWFCNLTSIHIFVDGIDSTGKMVPKATYNRHLVYGETYRVSVGVVIPIDGEFASKKMFIVLLNDEILSFIPTTSDLLSSYNIGLAGTEGVLRSVDNLKKVSFISEDGVELESLEVKRGEKVSSKEATIKEGKIFLGWFDELGNLWNFENNRVLKDTKLFAKYGDKTIDAIVLDEFGMEIEHGYKVKIGSKVSEIELPLVNSDILEFDGWYDNGTLLNSDDVITENMKLECRFNVKVNEPQDPVDPVDPVEPVDPAEPKDNTNTKKGCKSMISSGLCFIGLSVLASSLLIIRKKKERE